MAVLTALGVGAFFGSLYGPDRKQYVTVTGDKAGQNDYQGPSQSLSDIAGLPGLVERAIANRRPETGKDHEKRELAAQEASALWAFWMVLASFLSVLITAVGTFFLYKQIVLTRKAVQDTGDATKAMETANMLAIMSQRAWVFVDEVEILHDLNGSVIRVLFKNFGQYPAPGFASEVVARNHEYPFWAQPLEKATNDFAIMSLAPGQRHPREVRDFNVVGADTKRTRISISWSYQLPDGTTIYDFEDWIVVEEYGIFEARRMLPIDSINHPKNAKGKI